MVEPEPPNCPDGHTLESLAGDTLQLEDRPAVEAHVQDCSTCRDRLAAMIGDSPTNQIDTARIAALSRRPDPVDLPQAGDVIMDKYRVEGVVGRGGMGVVLGARHTELGHLVAIKVLHSNSPLATPRFLREARTSVRLSGEHVVRVFDYGKLAQGSPFLVMEYLQGEDLAKVVAHGLVPIDTAIRYMIETCQALEEAHALGVVHRDLKPANLFVVYDAKAESRIKVLDFGISKWLHPEDEALELTASDAVMGSPLYMSPEQVRASRDVDLRTDIWAVGVVLYELVAGSSPFAAASAPAVAVRVAASTPQPLSEARVGVPAELEALVMRCLEKDPAARFQSVSELADALRAVLAALRARASAPHAPRTAARLRWVLAASALLLLGALLAWAYASGRGREQKIQAATSTSPAASPPSAAAPTGTGERSAAAPASRAAPAVSPPSAALGSGAVEQNSAPATRAAPPPATSTRGTGERSAAAPATGAASVASPQPAAASTNGAGGAAAPQHAAVPATEAEHAPTRHSLDIGEVLPP